MHNFLELKIWQKSRSLVPRIYKMSATFPDYEKFGLRSQIQRAVISISSNIAEGSSKSSNKDFNRFLEVALGSLCEVESLLYLSFDLTYIDQNTLNSNLELITELKKMIIGFKIKLGF